MEYKNRYNEWLINPYFDNETKKELLSIENNEQEIKDRFYKNLEFGTGGLRGIIGAGTNRVNKYTIRKVTLGLANYILNKYGEKGKQKGVAIAYDCRFKSEELAMETAKTLATSGIKSYIYDSLRTTPQLSYTVRQLECIAGVVITASHNPPEYNGYKVYWTDGGQVCPNIANEIIEEINKINDYNLIPTVENSNLIITLDEKIDKDFINAVKQQVIRQDIINKIGSSIKIIYTPLHGTGNIPIRKVLQEVGFKNVIVVKEQEIPDSKFKTVKTPNPEEKEVFNIAIEKAKHHEADIIIGTDPDCDRVGVVVRNNEGEFITLNGNQIGSLLVSYVLSNKIQEIKTMNNPTIIKTIVTSELGATIANFYNVECANTLTGFKYIGEKIHQYETTNEATFIMGYEESHGYLIGTHARDKDGVVSTLLISEMAAYYYDRGMSLYEGLQELYQNYGYFKEELKSITLKGIDGMEQMNTIMNKFRNSNISKIANIKVLEIKDYKKGIDSLPKSDVIKFILEDGSWVAVRPSGTEPKIKFYCGCNGNNKLEVEHRLENIINSILILK